ncbi:MAG TPA: response regulator transcription factor [Candidatus Limnocylindria bacterium]|jgi:DNA-binding NarL/FixJ family response regulator|nr:response regulator transcription factor [Candidatus Limnocylindria bacterium]
MNNSPNAITRLLVIEDEPQMLRNLVTILRAEGFSVLGAPGGEEGVALARAQRPDLILCDLMMPGVDGFEVLNRIRADSRMSPIPFIFLTAKGERDEIRAGMNHGADDYLTKPVKVDDLLTAIRARLQRQEQAQSANAGKKPSKPSDLLGLGLTDRQAEVLFWLIEGKANSDIAGILGIAPATAKKHLEHIFTTLGVENRTAAIMAALERWAAEPTR